MSIETYLQRKITLPYEITPSSSRMFIAMMQHVAKNSSVSIDGEIVTIIQNAPFFIEVATTGGCIYSTQHMLTHMLSIQETIHVGTVNVSLSASAGAILSLFGTLGLRIAVKGAMYLFHPIQLSILSPDSYKNVEKGNVSVYKYMENIINLLTTHLLPLKLNKKQMKRITDLLWCDTDVYLTAEEMLDLKLIDRIIEPSSLYTFVENAILEIAIAKTKEANSENNNTRRKSNRKHKTIKIQLENTDI